MSSRLSATVLVVLLGFVALIGFNEPLEAQTNYVLTTATAPVSTPDQVTAWQRINNNQLGVAGKDPVGHKIGPNVAKKYFPFGLNWYPFDVYKQTLIGKLHHFNFYDGSGDEADWNNYIIPVSLFDYILKDALPNANRNDVHDCIGKDDCLEAEITPDESFYENIYFTKSSDKSILEGKFIGTYGPWVYEEAHENRPEIHPSELYWWRDDYNLPGNPIRRHCLLLLQDDSNRFDRPEDYSGTIVRPWSASPRTGEFKIAFELNPTNPPLRFGIEERYARNVVTADDLFAKQDADDGKNHAIEYNGKIVLTVDEQQPVDDNIGVKFVEVARNASNTRLQGYIVITSKVGKGDRGDEGYHLIRIAQSLVGRALPATPVIPETPLTPINLVKVIPQTLRYAVVNGEPKLVGNLQIQTMDSTTDVTFAKVILVNSKKQSRSVEFEAAPRATRSKGEIGVVKDVEMLGGSTLELRKQSGDVMKLAIPGVTLAPQFSEKKTLLSKDSQQAWPNFVKAAGGSAISGTPPAQVKKFEQFQIDAAPMYAALRNGKASLEDDSPIAKELNSVFNKEDLTRTRELFGSDQPIKTVKWSFTAKNLTSGKAVSVKVAPATSATGIRVEFLQSKLQNASIKVTFPEQPANAIFELIATAEMTDTFGNKGSIKQSVWSHALSGEDKSQLLESILPTVVDLAGVTSSNKSKLLAASKIDNLPDDDSTVSDPFSRRARMLRLIAMRASEDGSVDVDELRRLKRVAELFKSR